MKKIFKTGFSLAELLIAMGIVAIIATMAFTISKRGIERAYNLYYYTGYKGISDAIKDANNDGLELNFNDIYNSDFAKRLYYLLARDPLDLESDEYTSKELGDSYTPYTSSSSGASKGVRFTAKNGIVYTFEQAGEYTKTDDTGADNTCHYYKITMTVPSARKNTTAAGNTVTLYYLKDDDSVGYLVPYSDGVNLQERMDLLPFFLDDSNVGRVIKNEDGNYTYTKRKFMSFKDAYCLSNDKKSLEFPTKSGYYIVNCSDVSGSTVDGVILTVVNPRKI